MLCEESEDVLIKTLLIRGSSGSTDELTGKAVSRNDIAPDWM